MTHEQHSGTDKPRLTIGYLDDNLQNDFHNNVLIGIAEAAAELDVNVIRFGYYSSHIAYKFSHQASMVLDHVSQYHLDGLIFLGWTQAGPMYNETAFMKRFAGLPMLSMGTIFEKIPSVYFSGDEYISRITRHLIEEHGFGRIAYIEHHRPDNRRDFYDKEMQAAGLADPDLYVSADQLAGLDQDERNRKALSILFDERGIKVEAIISLNIIEAGYLIDDLERRGLRVPEDVAVVTYEDSNDGRFATPGRSTVYFPWRELGYMGCRYMVRLLRSGHIPMVDQINRMGRLLLRESCGCLPHYVQTGIAGTSQPQDQSVTDLTNEQIESMAVQLSHRHQRAELNFAALIHAYVAACRERDSKVFLQPLVRQMSQISNKARINEVIASLRSQLYPWLLCRQDDFLWGSNLLMQAQTLVQERSACLIGNAELKTRAVEQNLQIVSQQLLLDFSLNNLSRSLTDAMKRLGISSCCLFLSDAVLSGNASDVNLFEQCSIAYHYRNGQLLPVNGQSDSLKQHLRDLSSEEQEQVSLAYLLHVTDEILGFVLFGAGSLLEETVYQLLSTHISTALHGIMLLQRLDTAYRQLVDNAYREGMTEIAIDILHNIGNVLNSVHVSRNLIDEQLQSQPLTDLVKAGQLLRPSLDNLSALFTPGGKGQKLARFYLQLDLAASEVQNRLDYNLRRLSGHIELISQWVSTQQQYTGTDRQIAKHQLVPMLEDVLNLHQQALLQYQVRIVRDFKRSVSASVYRAKMFFVLFTLIDYVRKAMRGLSPDQRVLYLSTDSDTAGSRLTISNTGLRIDDLNRAFQYESARDDYQSYNLYSCFSTLQDMGGALRTEVLPDTGETAIVIQFGQNGQKGAEE